MSEYQNQPKREPIVLTPGQPYEEEAEDMKLPTFEQNRLAHEVVRAIFWHRNWANAFENAVRAKVWSGPRTLRARRKAKVAERRLESLLEAYREAFDGA